MAQIGQAFLHASLLGTEAEATRLREIKAEVFRQQQQRRAFAGGEISKFSTCRNRHMLRGLQHSFEQQHLASAAGVSAWPLKQLLTGAMQHRLQPWLSSSQLRGL